MGHFAVTHRLLLIAALYATLLSCKGKLEVTTDGTPEGTILTKFTLSGPGKQQITISQAAGFAPGFALSPSAATDTARNYGDSGTDGIKSLKYLINSIYICKQPQDHDPSLDGPAELAGHGGLPNCISLYSNRVAFYDIDPQHPEMTGEIMKKWADYARTDTNPAFIDMMDAKSRNSLGAQARISRANIGSYSYGYVSWYLPVKLTAEVYAGSTTLYTHDGTTTAEQIPGAGLQTANWSPVALTTAPAEEAIILSNIGHSNFRFQNPLLIAPADTTEGASLVLDLAFNPGSMLTCFIGGGGGGITSAHSVPMQTIGYPDVQIMAIPHKVGETIGRETYLFNVTGATGPENRPNPYIDRIELYYINEDPEKKIISAGSRGILGADSIAPAGMILGIGGIEVQADGSLTLLGPDNYKNAPIIKNFKRQTTVGAAATASLVCNQATGMGILDCITGNPASAVYGKLVDISTLGE